MSYKADIIADSVGPNGVRLTTFVVTFPRFILAEVNTHRVASKNSASSRAKPIERRLREMEDGNWFMPDAFGRNKKGMSSTEELSEHENQQAINIWVQIKKACMAGAGLLSEVGAHKQWAARPLECFSWHTAVITATEWENFFNLRTDKNAQPEFQSIAKLMKEVYDNSTPKLLSPGEWHLPFITEGETFDVTVSNLDEQRCLVSAGRCATVSYDNLGAGVNWRADYDRAQKLSSNGHMSPFEHQACCLPDSLGSLEERWMLTGMMPLTGAVSTIKCWWGNLRGWGQFRKTIKGEAVWHPTT